MTRYWVWHSSGKRDGDSIHDNLAEAEAEFEDQRAERNVVEVVLTEETDDGPVTLQYWSATED